MEANSWSSRIHIYLSTMFVFFGMFYLLGVLVYLKEPIAKEYGLEQSFLGAMDAMLFLGAALGSIFTALYSITKPVKALLVFSLCEMLSIEFQLGAELFPPSSRFLFGLFFASALLAQSIINHHFNEENDQKWVSIWYSASALGDSFGILICSFFLVNLGFSWQLSLTFCVGIFGLFSLYLFCSVNEIIIQSEEETISVSEKIKLRFESIGNYWKSGVNLIHTIASLTVTSMYELLLVWLPYYFTVIGFGNHSAYISFFYPVAFFIGTIISQPLLIKFKSYFGLFFLVMLLINNFSSIGLILLNQDPSNIIFYYILVFVASLAVSGFLSYTSTTDLKNRTSNNRDYLMINSTNRLLIRGAQIIVMVISGYLIQKDIKGFLKLYTVLMGGCTLLVLLRIVKYPNSFGEQQEKKNQIEAQSFNEEDI